MVAPEKAKSRDRDQKTAVQGNLLDVFAQQGLVVVDVFQNVHQQDQVCVDVIDLTYERSGLSGDRFDRFSVITGVDAPRLLCIRVGQQVFREETRTGTHVKNLGWTVAS